jgi:hypothetical protein
VLVLVQPPRHLRNQFRPAMFMSRDIIMANGRGEVSFFFIGKKS